MFFGTPTEVWLLGFLSILLLTTTLMTLLDISGVVSWSGITREEYDNKNSNNIESGSTNKSTTTDAAGTTHGHKAASTAGSMGLPQGQTDNVARNRLRRQGYQRRAATFLYEGEVDCTDENGKVTKVNVRAITCGRILESVGGTVIWIFGGRQYVLEDGKCTSRPAPRSEVDRNHTMCRSDAGLIYPVTAESHRAEKTTTGTQTDVGDVTKEVTIPIVRSYGLSFKKVVIGVLVLSFLINTTRAYEEDEPIGQTIRNVRDWTNNHNPIKIPTAWMDGARQFLTGSAAFVMWICLFTPAPAIVGGIYITYNSANWQMGVVMGVIHLTMAFTSKFSIIPAMIGAAMPTFWSVACNVLWVICVEPENLSAALSVIVACAIIKIAFEAQARPIADPVSATPMTMWTVLKHNCESLIMCIFVAILATVMHTGTPQAMAVIGFCVFSLWCCTVPAEEYIVTTRTRTGRVFTTKVQPKTQARNGLWFKLRAKMAATRTSEAMWDNCFKIQSGIWESTGFQYRGMMWVLDHGIEEGKSIVFTGLTRFPPNKRKPEKVRLEHDGTTGFGVDGQNIVRQPKLATETSDGWKTMIHFDSNGQKCASVFYGVWRDQTLTGLTTAQNGDSGAPVYNEDGQLEAVYMGGGTGVALFSAALPLKLRPLMPDDPLPPLPLVSEVEQLEAKPETVAFTEHAMRGQTEELTELQDLKLQMRVLMTQVCALVNRKSSDSDSEEEFEMHKKKKSRNANKIKNKQKHQKTKRGSNTYRIYPRQCEPVFRDNEYDEMRNKGIPQESIEAAAKQRWIDRCNERGNFQEVTAEREDSSGDSDDSATYSRHARVFIERCYDYNVAGLKTGQLPLVSDPTTNTAIVYDDGRCVEHEGMTPGCLTTSSQVSMLQKRNEQLATEVENLVVQHEQNVSEIESLSNHNDHLKDVVHDYEVSNSDLQSVIDLQKEMINGFEVERRDHQERCRHLESENTDLRDGMCKQATDFGAIIDSLKVEIERLSSAAVADESTWTVNKGKKKKSVVFDVTAEPASEFNYNAAKRKPSTMPCGNVTTAPNGHWNFSKNKGGCDCGKEPKCPAGVEFTEPCAKHCNHWWCASQKDIECDRPKCGNIFCVEKKKGVSDMTPKDKGSAGGSSAGPIAVS
uniref:ORF1a n=1 Tax=Dongbei arctic lamprey astrovirus 4 TaxID=2116126 RepID=A0A2P1GMC9_9VIRU|nr:ORF1a [Dongbei arctic lamprey astrovirus 4]